MKSINWEKFFKIIITIVNAFFFVILIIILAHFVEALTDDNNESLFAQWDSKGIITFVAILISMVGCVYCWLKPKLGAILTIVASLGLLYLNFSDLHFWKWPVYALFSSGILLLVIRSKKEQNISSESQTSN